MLAVAGISHKTAPLEVRERLALTAEDLKEMLPALRASFGAVIVLSTCNRTEAYCGGADATERAAAIAGWIANARGFSYPALSSHFYSLEGAGAVRHLFRVASGLDSMLVGEIQILGQVRGALHAAERAGSADRLLTRIFQTAVAVGRKARAHAGSTPPNLSISAAAAGLARSFAGDLAQCRILVVGTGEAASLTARSLTQQGARQLVITGRTYSRALKLATELGATAIPFLHLRDALREIDIAISATSGRRYQIDAPAVAAAMTDREGRPLLLIDLAVPRDISPAAAEIPGVLLHDIDALQPFLPTGDPEDAEAMRDVEAVLEEEVAGLVSWWQDRWVVPTISALRDQAEAIRRGELTKTLGRLPNLSADERRRIDALTSAIVKKLLHQPIMCIRESEGEPAYLEAVRELFALDTAVK
jgi:glutamyl-tRNA reductase